MAGQDGELLDGSQYAACCVCLPLSQLGERTRESFRTSLRIIEAWMERIDREMREALRPTNRAHTGPVEHLMTFQAPNANPTQEISSVQTRSLESVSLTSATGANGSTIAVVNLDLDGDNKKQILGEAVSGEPKKDDKKVGDEEEVDKTKKKKKGVPKGTFF